MFHQSLADAARSAAGLGTKVVDDKSSKAKKNKKTGKGAQGEEEATREIELDATAKKDSELTPQQRKNRKKNAAAKRKKQKAAWLKKHPCLTADIEKLMQHPEASSLRRLGLARQLWTEGEALREQAQKLDDPDHLGACVQKYAMALLTHEKAAMLVLTSPATQNGLVAMLHARAKQFSAKLATPGKLFYFMHAYSGLVWLENIQQAQQGIRLGLECPDLTPNERAVFLTLKGRLYYTQLMRLINTNIKSDSFKQHSIRCERSFREAIALDATFGDPYIRLYALYASQENNDKVLRVLEQYLDAMEEDVDEEAYGEVCLLWCAYKLNDLESRRNVKFLKFHKKLKDMYWRQTLPRWILARELRAKAFWGPLTKEEEKLFTDMQTVFKEPEARAKETPTLQADTNQATAERHPTTEKDGASTTTADT